ncbi:MULTISPECIES: glycogen/starch/alpha-glucan phosphorylase [unclassified Thermosynechococcus]|uniref:glycogen/starch/alpha-glucan phosphorylase n=1 Tax=unclassified Thermosynechococcus TaxID=2622553 RepID=UPI0019FC7557|nr:MULTISPECIES: glycogen/starch/alpha-glucan phosphorylase [unclassified Thermosynechococcus]HIK34242.1 glycogen/starch/alpha-glucan phosphorylase [Thermosynechococcus sp. M98_K2018_005]HIK47198.1 glycogen/starch/alpha-glucan phosphorylase [Thermosynechococcus sp. M55_K2018_012]
MTSLIPPGCPTVLTEDDRTGTSIETLRRAFMDNLFFIQGRFPEVATKNDYYLALAYTVRDRLLLRWLNSAKTYREQESRTVCYFSAEFLLGPHLGNNLINLGLYEAVEEAIRQTGLNLKELLDQEEEPGLGNGGLGRLAACYMDSLATLEIPAIGYGIRYEYGIFDQEIRDGWQVEITDKWLRYGNPWEIPRPELILQVKFGGHTYSYTDDQGRYRVVWEPHQVIQGVAYDTPILGYKVNTANLLRLWRAEAVESFDFQAFNTGDYYGAVNQKIASENITKVLYPNDEQLQGKELRLMQQYFFCSCALQDMIRLYKQSGNQDLSRFHEKFTVQLNDTHPAISVAELMRLLVDEHLMPWEQAWDITCKTFAYTNHTLLPEALEKWPLHLFGSLLPRHLQIIYEINQRFLDQVRLQYPGDNDRLRRLSIIDESGCRYVRMAHLAAVGSHAINGVAALHSELLKQTVLKDFYELTPEKFSNKTNGVTPRRWIVLSNPGLTRLISERIGEDWVKHLEQLRQLEPLAENRDFAAQWRSVKHGNKERLAEYIRNRVGVTVDPHSLFSILVKRIHEYKRQHLCVLNIITLYQMLKDNPQLEMVPQTFIFGGKAAPGYYMAKLIIKLINSVADVINRDPVVRDRLKVVFLPDYNVTLGQRVYPAADLSQQISTAGYEASGTGNMKFALNGALTIGTLDGANVEIREEVGAENFFLFGHTVEQLQELWRNGYRPWEFANSNPMLKRVLDLIGSGYFSHGDTELFRPIVEHLWQNDRYCLLADYQSYVDCHQQVLQVYQDQAQWSKMSILNVARMGKFSSDRAIREYCQDIWHVEPVKIVLPQTSYMTPAVQ